MAKFLFLLFLFLASYLVAPLEVCLVGSTDFTSAPNAGALFERPMLADLCPMLVLVALFQTVTQEYVFQLPATDCAWSRVGSPIFLISR